MEPIEATWEVVVKESHPVLWTVILAIVIGVPALVIAISYTVGTGIRITAGNAGSLITSIVLIGLLGFLGLVLFNKRHSKYEVTTEEVREYTALHIPLSATPNYNARPKKLRRKDIISAAPESIPSRNDLVRFQVSMRDGARHEILAPRDRTEELQALLLAYSAGV